MEATLGELNTSYRKFGNKDEITVDYLIMGPGLSVEDQTQAQANLLISLVGKKGLYQHHNLTTQKLNVVGVNDTDTDQQNLLRYFSSLSSSSYAVFDSGYKYTYDRFNNEFRYLPCNGDVAGLMVRTSIEASPWFSPTGLSRGVLNNAC